MSNEQEPTRNEASPWRRRMLIILAMTMLFIASYGIVTKDSNVSIQAVTPNYATLESTPLSPDTFTQPTFTPTSTATPTPWALHFVLQPLGQECPPGLKEAVVVQPDQTVYLETDTPIETSEQFTNVSKQDVVICTSPDITPVPPTGGGRG